MNVFYTNKCPILESIGDKKFFAQLREVTGLSMGDFNDAELGLASRIDNDTHFNWVTLDFILTYHRETQVYTLYKSE